MIGFRTLLVLFLVILLLYTGVVIANHGVDLLTIFFGDIAKMGWPGQFNLDFTFMLILSALWTAWRNRFSGTGIMLSFLALIGGSLFLSIYLLALSWKTKGDFKKMLLGDALGV